jgi:hypothetical protein
MIRPCCIRGAGAKVTAVALGFLALTSFAPHSLRAQQAQQKAQSTAGTSPAAGTTYDARNETMVQGTVVSYTTDSVTPPMGTRVLVQTGSGTLDVHLGSNKLLTAAKMTLNPGDSVRLVGANIALPNGGSFFAARILQKGAQSVTLRNSQGVVLKAVPRDAQSLAALRGVR